MGEVHRAFDTVQQRFVALKRLPAALTADPDYQRRFRREAALCARLQDPHIIPIHGFGEIDGRLYIDMRLVDGPDLGSLIAASGPLEPERAVAVVEQIGEALDAAHRAGLLHRDVKPSNILVTPSDFAYLVDFGLVRAMSEQSGTALTASGAALGTPTYMAPERFTGEPVDQRGDVYGLACVLYQALTGNRPFSPTEPLALMHAHLHAPPPQPSQFRSALAPFDAVISAGMAKDPDARPMSCGDLTRSARGALRPTVAATRSSPSPTASVRQPPTEPAPPPSQGLRRRLAVAGSAAGVLAVLALAVSTAVALGTREAPSAALQPPPSTQEVAAPTGVGIGALEDVVPVALPAPPFDREAAIASDPPEGRALSTVSEEPNNIVDTDGWFADNGLAVPRVLADNADARLPRSYRGFSLDQVIEQDAMLLLLYGSVPDALGDPVLSPGQPLPLIVVGVDSTTLTVQYALDLSAYRLAPEFRQEDAGFVDQSIVWAQQVDDVLYVSHGHWSYAASTFGANAYVSAIDTTSGDVLWHSAPLTSNARTFAVMGDALVTGYGYTDEADRLLVLDRHTGTPQSEMPLASGPEYVVARDDLVYVRCYDTDYVVRLEDVS